MPCPYPHDCTADICVNSRQRHSAGYTLPARLHPGFQHLGNSLKWTLQNNTNANSSDHGSQTSAKNGAATCRTTEFQFRPYLLTVKNRGWHRMYKGIRIATKIESLPSWAMPNSSKNFLKNPFITLRVILDWNGQTENITSHQRELIVISFTVVVIIVVTVVIVVVLHLEYVSVKNWQNWMTSD